MENNFFSKKHTHTSARERAQNRAVVLFFHDTPAEIDATVRIKELTYPLAHQCDTLLPTVFIYSYFSSVPG